jgi:hypothetical protein
MRRNWKYGLMCVVAGLCCFATVAEVDAGIVFRRRPGLFGRRRPPVVTTTTRQVATTTVTPSMTVRGQTPAAALPATGAPATPAQPAR